jgi:hypothetical protein
MEEPSEGLQVPVTATTIDENGNTVVTGFPPDGTGPSRRVEQVSGLIDVVFDD